MPYVRHAWDGANPVQLDPYANEELQPELRQLGLNQLPEPAAFIDICPPSLRPPGMGRAQRMRWIPGNLQRKLEPWMYSRGSVRRICVTSGSRVSFSDSHDFLHALVENVASLEAEIVVAAPEDAAAKLRERLPGIRTGWIPLDVVAPTCDVIVHHGGGVTSMTAINAGTPQLAIPQWSFSPARWKGWPRTAPGLLFRPPMRLRTPSWMPARSCSPTPVIGLGHVSSPRRWRHNPFPHRWLAPWRSSSVDPFEPLT